MLFLFKPEEEPIGQVFPSFLLGLRFQRKWFVIAALVLGVFIYGGFSAQPLQGKLLLFYKMVPFTSCLEPLAKFFTTLKFRKPPYQNKAKEVFPFMKEWMGLDAKEFGYKRTVTANSTTKDKKPNVVLVFCESFSMYKSSMSSNPLNTTPYFKSGRQWCFF